MYIYYIIIYIYPIKNSSTSTFIIAFRCNLHLILLPDDVIHSTPEKTHAAMIFFGAMCFELDQLLIQIVFSNEAAMGIGFGEIMPQIAELTQLTLW